MRLVSILLTYVSKKRTNWDGTVGDKVGSVGGRGRKFYIMKRKTHRSSAGGMKAWALALG